MWGPTQIAFDREQLRGGEAAPAYQIWLMNPNGSGRKQVTHTKVPTLLEGLVPMQFSADGERLLTQLVGQDTSETWTIEVASAKVRQLTVRGVSVTAGGLSQDGTTVLVDYNGFLNPPSAGTVETSRSRVGGRRRSSSAPDSRAGTAEPRGRMRAPGRKGHRDGEGSAGVWLPNRRDRPGSGSPTVTPGAYAQPEGGARITASGAQWRVMPVHLQAGPGKPPAEGRPLGGSCRVPDPIGKSSRSGCRAWPVGKFSRSGTFPDPERHWGHPRG